MPNTTEDRLAALEASNRRLRTTCRALVAVVILGVLVGAGAAVPSLTASRNFRLTDAAGRTRAELKMVNSQPMLTFYNISGQEEASFGVAQNEPRLRLMGSGATPLSVVGVYNNAPYLDMYDGAGERRVAIDAVADSAGLSLFDQTGTERAALQVSTFDSPGLVLSNNQGSDMLSVREGGVNLNDRTGLSRLAFNVSTAGYPFFSMRNGGVSISHVLSPTQAYTDYSAPVQGAVRIP